jgi:two-component system NtrC family sensor kinase
MAALGRLTSSMAHEVNNPLTAVLGYLQILLRTPGLPEPVLRDLLKVDAEVRRIQVIVKDMLGYARSAPAAKEPVDLARVAEAGLDFARSEFAYRKIKVERDLPASLPPVLGDANQMRQVLLNLFVNAMHAMEGRPGSKLRVAARAENGRVVVEVADNGPGMPAEVQDRVFEPFFTTKGENKGTGLGLYVSAGILERHGGALTFESKPDRGTTFRLTLPAADGDAVR